MYYKTKGYRIFSVANYIFLGVLSLLCILPIIHILAVSFSSMAPASANLVGFWPIGFTTDAYVKTFGNSNFINSLLVSVKRTVIATVIGMVIMLLTAFPLSKEDINFKGRSIYTWFFVFTILFSGGLIPSYILVQKLGLMDTIWALVLPGALSVWNVILMMNFFRGLPKELEEAAYLDGAGHIKTLALVYVPLSMPAIATLSLFTMVGQWNSWFDGMIYMSDVKITHWLPCYKPLSCSKTSVKSTWTHPCWRMFPSVRFALHRFSSGHCRFWSYIHSYNAFSLKVSSLGQ